jgi:HEPN domain-containing protein
LINDEVRNWLKKAINDFTASQLLLDSFNDNITDTVCFHAEQFVEKSLKAYLVFKNVSFMKTHDLEYLIKLCLEIDTEFIWLNEVAMKLSDYAVDIRYPDDFYMPSTEEAKESVFFAEKVKTFIFKKMNISEKDL